MDEAIQAGCVNPKTPGSTGQERTSDHPDGRAVLGSQAEGDLGEGVAFGAILDPEFEREWSRAFRYWSEGQRAMVLAQACGWALRQQAHLMDLQYVRERTTAVMAREAVLGTELLEEPRTLLPWVREAMHDTLIEEEARYVLQTDGGGRWQAAWLPKPKPALDWGDGNSHALLAPMLGVQRHLTLAASVRFHRLPAWTRHAFYALILDGQSVPRCLELGFGPQARLLLEARRCLKALLFLEDLWPEIQIPGKPMEEHPHEL